MSKRDKDKNKEKEKEKEDSLVDNLLMIKKAIIKKYGNVISRLIDHQDMVIPTVSTGSISLDLALGRGGMALGRIYEIFGPASGGKSTLAANVIINAQERGMKCCYIDSEHAIDPLLFKNYGVDLTQLDLVQAYTGEENLDILEMLITSGVYQVAVIDSVSSLIPSAEAEAEISNDFMALLARLMGKALRRFTPIANRTGTLTIFINQLRHKIGGYGCFHYDTLVNFVDGRSIPIGKVVDEKINGSVWTLNENTNMFEAKPIVDWHDNGKVETNTDLIHIQTTSINGRGRFGFTCTPEHKILTSDGWIEAKNIHMCNKIVSKYTETFNGTYADFLRGTLIGDSCISIRDKNTGSLRLQDNDNMDYIGWKIAKLSKFIKFNKTKINKGFKYSSDYTYEFAKIKQELGERDPMYLLNNYTDLSFALWIMDDGNYDTANGHNRYSISVKRYNGNELKLKSITDGLCDKGFDCSYDLKRGIIHFKTFITDTVAGTICRYVPESMQYKLPVQYKNKYEEFELYNDKKIIIDYVEIKEIRFASDRQMRQRRKFDISISDNHNYMVGGYKNGVVIHNSSEITTGGEALAFYATGRISVRGPESRQRRIIDAETGTIIGHETIFEVVKNKLAPPFKTASIKLIYGKGYDKYWEILSLASELGIIDKTGAWYKYNDKNIAQGEINAVSFLRDNEILYSEIRNKVIEMVGLRELYEQNS